MSINVTVLCLALAAVAFDYIANRDDLNSEPQLQYVNDTGSSELNVEQEPLKIELPPRGVVLGAVYVGQ
ncbi:hypothetical protein [Photobacterium alginatilyticum]|uniref:Uncharacterized protein n=1 Tax=Photobacterium alginatilyticum TaxID=1775171 RepID=A0ABW9YJ46_9GAMM|nr:hypothetical protein [Photobacterium alginatilyticum]NBI53806.1 hypothetical protein [Photobacterium alginatilyticum]